MISAVSALTALLLAAPAFAQTPDVGLLVTNAAHLDAEAQAAYGFASSRGLTVSLIDPGTALADPGVLEAPRTYWAAASAEPTGYNTPSILAALTAGIETAGKLLVVSDQGALLIQYLGYGTVSPGPIYHPAVNDAFYWVSPRTPSPMFSGMTSWIPPAAPDLEVQLFAHSFANPAPGYAGPLTIGWSLGSSSYDFALLLTTYGWCFNTFDPALQDDYGIASTCERGVVTRDLVVGESRGSGHVLEWPFGVSGSTGWHLGPAGEQLLASILRSGVVTAAIKERVTPLELYPAHPNPFNPHTAVRFRLPAEGVARLAIYDAAGRLTRVLVNRQLPGGIHEAVWDGRDQGGAPAASGSYFARLEAGGMTKTVRLALVR